MFKLSTFPCLLLGIIMAASFFVPRSFNPEIALAASPDLGLAPLEDSGLATDTDLRVIIARIIRAILGFLGVLALGITLYGGFVYMTARGDAERVETAKKILRNGVIGLVIIMGAYTIASFVIRSLTSATGVGGGSGAGGRGGIGGFGAGGSDIFTVDNITPKGDIPIKNVVVRIVFNASIEPGSIRDRISVLDLSSGEEVSGHYDVAGNIVEFTPSQACTEDPKRFCFLGDTEFDVRVIEGIVASEVRKTQKNAYRTDGIDPEGEESPEAAFGSGAITLACRAFAISDNCTARFKTGNLVDSLGPDTRIINPAEGQGVPGGEEGASVDVLFGIEDNSGISYSQLWTAKKGEGFSEEGLFSPLDEISPRSVEDALILWNTENLEKGSIYNLKIASFDIDTNSKESEIMSVIVRPLHCFDEELDKDLGEVVAGPPACGGDCGQCGGGVCVTSLDCAQGACLAGKCVSLPEISEVFPSDGASGTFVTVYGQGFGDALGKVSFLGGAGPTDDVAASLPGGQCGNTWHDDFVIVEVPSAAKTGPISLSTSHALMDTTADSRGIQMDFTVNNNRRPSICLVDPEVGEPFSDIRVVGKNFGPTAGTGANKSTVKFGNISAPSAVWGPESITNIKIPLLRGGETFVSVDTVASQSNRVPFMVKESETLPRIEKIIPSSGPVSQYITLSGVNFGSAAGSVEFIGSDGKTTLADIEFPKECKSNYWHPESVVVKVPPVFLQDASGEILYRVILKTSGGAQSNFVDFDVNTRERTPGLCAISPDNGPAGLEATAIGEGFGAFVAGDSSVRFSAAGTGAAAGIASWDVKSVVVSVPPAAQSGDVILIDSTGTQSNGVLFTVGVCQADTCQEGLVCCGNGACSAQCDEPVPFCAYKWSFSTGKVEGWPCADDGDCSCPSAPTADNPCMTCSPSGVCQASCSSDADCREGSSCQCGSGKNSACFCQSNAPFVIEDETCGENSQSPSPFISSEDACTNAKISARFSVNMSDDSLFISPDENFSSILVKECNAGDRLDPAGCRLLEGELSLINSGLSGEGFIFVGGSADSPRSLRINTWYQVLIRGGDHPLAVRASPELGGLAMREDYIWSFKTKESCTASKVLVLPGAKTFTDPSLIQNFTSEAVAANCNMITVPASDWKWSTQKNDGPFISIFDVLDDHSEIIGDAQSAMPAPFGLLTPANDPAQLTAQLCRGGNACSAGLQDSADVSVLFDTSSPNPRVIIDPSCSINTQSPSPFMSSTGACANALISARFNKDMNDDRLLDPSQVQLRKCGDGDKFDSGDCDDVLSGIDSNGDSKADALSKVGADNAAGEGFLFVPSAEKLEPDTWYEARIAGGDGGMISEDGFPMKEDFVWHWKTRNSTALCDISRVLVTPPSALATFKGAKTRYSAVPLAANCNILRGNYLWKWDTTNPLNDLRVELSNPLGADLPDPILSTEQVANASFEDLDLSGWIRSAPASADSIIFKRVPSPGLLRENALRIDKIGGKADSLSEGVALDPGVHYRLRVHFKTDAGTSLPLVLDESGSGSIILALDLNSASFVEHFEDFKVPDFAKSPRIRFSAAAGQVLGAFVNEISIREVIESGGAIIAEARSQTLVENPIHIRAAILPSLKSDTGDLYIVFNKPRVVEQYPICQSACLNAALGGRFNSAMDLDSLEDNMELWSCENAVCASGSAKNISIAGSNADITAEFGTIFNLSPLSNRGLLEKDRQYRIVIRGGTSGVKSGEGVVLDGLNFDSNGDGIKDSYSWTFKTSTNLCVVASVGVLPLFKEKFLIGVDQDYVAMPAGTGDSCNPNGQKINPLTVDWRWLSSVNTVASISQGDLEPAELLDNRIDPFQTATTEGPGETEIIASNEPPTAEGKAKLKVTCGLKNDTDCKDSDIETSIFEWGINRGSGCCFARPRVIVPLGAFDDESVPDNALPLLGAAFPKPGINAGFSGDLLHPNPAALPLVCRNALIAAQFSERMNLADLTSNNIIVQINNSNKPCGAVVGRSLLERIKDTLLSLGGSTTRAEDTFCTVDGRLFVSNQGTHGMFRWKPDELMQGGSVYRVTIKGGRFDESRRNIRGGIKGAAGVSLAGDFVWEFKVKDEICEIRSVDVEVSRFNGDPSFAGFDFFRCGLRDDCLDDLYSERSGLPVPENQHKYTPYAYDKDRQLIDANFSWVNSNGTVLSICSEGSSCPVDLNASGVDGRLAKDDLAGGAAISTISKNGHALVTVLAQGPEGVGGSASKTIRIDSFMCQNPWPSSKTFPFTDSGELATNFSFFYCRDAGGPGLEDDLPPLSSPVVVAPGDTPADVIKDSNCPGVSSFVCGDDGKTYNNECVAKSKNVSILRKGRCDIGLIKELLFFVDVPDNVVRNLECKGAVEYLCGADNKTYYNRCVADKAGIAIARIGKCK
ncbi:MAG: Uncharacterized protein G01um101418_271 [Parcubacteria group bacterium Gr01-1014_18]|nr:MAG: Uncharacterized protein Greene041636_238 [Parcubacteria group bacterium Greene0416_36]TSC81289.1 MAG: Uncharacterized protein G01um101418_271 [Parcubacteria group bacterium Gr01-1014_18]TSC99311.1 MAG: Uncharacterized protein Greene101420_239 [Parcubacteria group bacterium Greene1014_20]TSD06852.1 MAG: Uncharacterized protein Greene07142_586 [Parcubacteria group bacterium Greene0714_2]